MLGRDALLLPCRTLSCISCGGTLDCAKAICSSAGRQLAENPKLWSRSYNTSRYDDLSEREEFKAILQEVSMLQDRLAALQGRSSMTVKLIRNIAFQSAPHQRLLSDFVPTKVSFWLKERVQRIAPPGGSTGCQTRLHKADRPIREGGLRVLVRQLATRGS